MSHINTISEFLLHAGTECHVFDMARGIISVNSQDFLEIESAQKPAPRPRQQHAWFGIIFFNKLASSEHYIWFIKLPLDEKGLVIEAGRQQFLHIVVEALGETLNNEKNPNNQLPENPFTFIPGQQQLADFNSLCKTRLGLPFSEHLESTVKYIQHSQNEDWRNISLQGIADFCATLETLHFENLLLTSFENLAPQIQRALCASLENHQLNSKLSQLLIDWGLQEPKNLETTLSVIRALSQSQARSQVKDYIFSVLKCHLGRDNTILMLIAARHWKQLADAEVLKLYIENLAQNDAASFVGLYSDLVQIPETRPSMLAVLRWTNKSPSLTQAIGKVFGQ
ncbi:MAG: DUF3549 family protein [Paraglaciecola sp.]|uniref:DUF3549 family protein n=1 Tax=Paraglaciecola sp. TaxID=1920173 RepID=UPI00329A19D2